MIQIHQLTQAEQELCYSIVPLEKRDWIERQDEEGAKAILDQAPAVSLKRYRFLPVQHQTQRDVAIQTLFQISFKQNPRPIVLNAERVTCKNFYPSWKRVLLIKTPEMLHKKLTHIVTKVMVLLAVSILSFTLGYRAYQAVGPLFASRILPLLINYTPLVLIRLFNQTMAAKEWVMENPFQTLASIWLTRELILRAPRIPYLTAAARTIDIGDLYWTIRGTPQSISGFLLDHVVAPALRSTITVCDTVGAYCRLSATKAGFEKEAVEKEGARRVWVQIANKLRPQQAIA